MKKQIIDLLLKMQAGENCIGETVNYLLDLFSDVNSLTPKDKLYLNTLLINKLLEKDPDGTYKAVNDIGIMDRVNDLMEKINKPELK